MSLRQAAQRHGVHHMSLHRRIRGRYASTLPPSSDIRSFLSPDDEAEVLDVLREQFLHERRITSDDVRFVVRAIASQGGKQSIPPEFPPSRWIMDFKRAHGFTKLNSYAYPPSDLRNDDDTGSNYSGYSSNVSSVATLHHHQHQRLVARDADSTMDTDDHRHHHHQQHPRRTAQDDEFPSSSNNSNPGYDAGLTTGSSSGGSYENGESEKRTYRLSHSVPAETWEKAIAAVEQQGMSLRAAAKLYGVHFAALHRRVKKRAQGKQGSGMEGYFQADDEAGIIRVVVARAELGVLMTFDELMDLVQRAALRNLPDLSVEAARKLMTRFQSRNEHSIRHIISDWPLPRANPLTAVPRVVNSPDQAHMRSVMPHARAASPSPPLPPPPTTSRSSYPSLSSSDSGRTAMMAQQVMHEAHTRLQDQGKLPRGPLPSLWSAEYSPLPSSSIFSRHPFPSSSSSVSGAPQRRLAPQQPSTSMDHHQEHYDAEDRGRYDDQPADGRRGSDSSDGDAVMFV